MVKYFQQKITQQWKNLQTNKKKSSQKFLNKPKNTMTKS